MELVVERCAGLDVHKDLVVACVCYPGPDGVRKTEIASFSAFTADLLALRDWLCSYNVTRVAMEATGVYWKPIFYVLEDAMECWLLNARHMRNVPGRKTDIADAEWICQLTEHGLVRPSFVAPKEIPRSRQFTRYRRTLAEERTREAQRLDKVLQDAGVKLSSVASDVLGASSRAMLAALVEGTRTPRRSPISRGASCARSCRLCAPPSKGASGPATQSWSQRSSPILTTSTRRSDG